MSGIHSLSRRLEQHTKNIQSGSLLGGGISRDFWFFLFSVLFCIKFSISNNITFTLSRILKFSSHDFFNINITGMELYISFRCTT